MINLSKSAPLGDTTEFAMSPYACSATSLNRVEINTRPVAFLKIQPSIFVASFLKVNERTLWTWQESLISNTIGKLLRFVHQTLANINKE